jgi:ABC-type transporter Mla subunit MlaD
VTIEVLEQVIVDTMELRDEQIEEIVSRLEQTVHEAARLMNELRAELAEARRNGSVTDPDAATTLDMAAHQLQTLSDGAAKLNEATEKLRNLGDSANQNNNAADRLAATRSFLSMANSATTVPIRPSTPAELTRTLSTRRTVTHPRSRRERPRGSHPEVLRAAR